MIKKSELRSEFERLVKNTTSFSAIAKLGCEDGVFRPTLINNVPVSSFRLDIEKNGSCYQIVLYAVHSVEVFAVIGRSYPFRTYKSAYQTLVRL